MLLPVSSKEDLYTVEISLAEMLKVVILGIVEGLTEWLPVSSTGHMILVDEFIRLNVSTAFMDMFLVVIQLGAILAVVVLNAKKLNPFLGSKSRAERRETLDLWGEGHRCLSSCCGDRARVQQIHGRTFHERACCRFHADTIRYSFYCRRALE